MALAMQNYRHKKFDIRRPLSDEDTEPELKAKQELQQTCSDTPAKRTYIDLVSDQDDQDTSSLCSSSYSTPLLPLLKRRRLNSTIYDDSIASETTSSTHSASLALTIKQEALREICKYHGNMVRKFPKKERTPKDQERRNKNTIACRMSRRVKKLEHLSIEEEYKEYTEQHLKIVEQNMRATVYFNHLNRLVQQSQAKSATSAAIQVPIKNFSIDFIMNGSQSDKC